MAAFVDVIGTPACQTECLAPDVKWEIMVTIFAIYLVDPKSELPLYGVREHVPPRPKGSEGTTGSKVKLSIGSPRSHRSAHKLSSTTGPRRETLKVITTARGRVHSGEAAGCQTFVRNS